MTSGQKRTYILVLIFSIAMGFLEAVVVVYLRKISYPHGFHFPLVLLPKKMYFTELSREFATLVMLVSLAFLAGKNRLERFAYFLFAFAVWDIIYYAGLKLLLNWPPSFMTWDILFLIPIPWVSPVLAPLICSLSMIFLAFGLTRGQQKVPSFRVSFAEWGLLLGGAVIVFWSFVRDYAAFLFRKGILNGTGKHTAVVLSRFSPVSFHWGLFIPGEILILISIAMIWKKRIRNE